MRHYANCGQSQVADYFHLWIRIETKDFNRRRTPRNLLKSFSLSFAKHLILHFHSVQRYPKNVIWMVTCVFVASAAVVRCFARRVRDQLGMYTSGIRFSVFFSTSLSADE